MLHHTKDTPFAQSSVQEIVIISLLLTITWLLQIKLDGVYVVKTINTLQLLKMETNTWLTI